MRSALIIGLGHFGTALVAELTKKKWELIVLEENPDRAELVKDVVDQIIVGNATNKELLEKFAKNVECAVVCLSEKIDSSVLIAHYLKEIGVKKIIAKATTKDHGNILKSLGADEIIFPEEETAKMLAMNLTSPDILDAIKLSDNFDIVEIPVPEKFIQKTIKGLQLRNKFEIEILAIKNPLSGKVNIMPSSEYEFQPDDVIIFIGTADSVDKLSKF